MNSGARRRRLAVVIPAVVVIFGVTAVQSGAAEACGRWLFGDGSRRTVQTGADAAASKAGGGKGASGAARPSGPPVLTVTDGADLGTVTGRFLLAGSTTSGAGRVAFAMRGPASVTVVDGRAPYRVSIDPRQMALPDGEYSVSVGPAGAQASDAVATLVLKTGYRGSKPTTGDSSRRGASQKPTSPPAAPAGDRAQRSQGSGAGSSSADRAADTDEQPTTAPGKPVTTAEQQPTGSTTNTSATSVKTSTPASKPASSAPAPVGSEAAEVIRLTNTERAAIGCPALTSNAVLTRSAQAHSEDMAANDYFSHTSQDGRSPFDRMKAAGYSYRMAAENIAAGQPTPQSVVTAWMNSAGHRANILNCSLTEIGVGVAQGGSYRIYWTQNFGTPR